MDLQALQDQYNLTLDLAKSLRAALMSELEAILRDNEITLGAPIEGRVKSWESLSEKIERRGLTLTRVEDQHDLVGLRLVLLFQRDVDKVCGLLAKNFAVLSSEDTGARLTETQFGYQSRHFVLKLTDAWLAIPSMGKFGHLKFELQVRTAAQHIWAAAAHKLQYKQEQSVPGPLRRSIHRVSALLEIVDLEFERVLRERDQYVAEAPARLSGESLNTNLVAAILGDILPGENFDPDDAYEELLQELVAFEIANVGQLESLLRRNRATIVSADKEQVKQLMGRDGVAVAGWPERIRKKLAVGVYFTQVGLARSALHQEFGKRWIDYCNAEYVKENQALAPPAVKSVK